LLTDIRVVETESPTFRGYDKIARGGHRTNGKIAFRSFG